MTPELFTTRTGISYHAATCHCVSGDNPAFPFTFCREILTRDGKKKYLKAVKPCGACQPAGYEQMMYGGNGSLLMTFALTELELSAPEAAWWVDDILKKKHPVGVMATPDPEIPEQPSHAKAYGLELAAFLTAQSAPFIGCAGATGEVEFIFDCDDTQTLKILGDMAADFSNGNDQVSAKAHTKAYRVVLATLREHIRRRAINNQDLGFTPPQPGDPPKKAGLTAA